MTVLVGVRCTDGVVVGADSVATSAMGNNMLLQIQTDKLFIVGDRIIVAGTGSVGLGQRFHNVLQKAWSDKVFSKPCWDCLRQLTTSALQDFGSTGVQQRPPIGIGFGALLAAPLDDKAQLVEFGSADLQPEMKDGKVHFVSMGSGQMLADPFVAFISRVLWKGEPPDVKAGMFGVYWALDHTIKYAPGGVGPPIKLAVLQRRKGQWNARLLEEDELQEQAQHIAQIEDRFGSRPAQAINEATVEPPPVPPAS